jgi:PQQ-dependent dehydrogenase (methanol/ethanol family)
MAPTRRDFPLVGGNLANQRYSALDQINTSNIKSLGGAWMIRVEEGNRGAPLGGTPIVLDGVMYVTTGSQNVIALDARSGNVKWRYQPDNPESGMNRGVVVADGKVIFGRRNNVLTALDQETGKVVWQTPPMTTQRAASTTGAPIYHDGVVFIGTGGGDNAARGQMGAYDVKTGKQIWTFSTVPAGTDDRFSETWEGDVAKRFGGGVWTHAALDPDLSMIYFGTGNAGPNYDGASRGGDNLLTSSLVALDIKTGAYKWHFQHVHHDIWDMDAASAPTLVNLMFRGQSRKVIIHAGKTGFLYILDRATGESLLGIVEKPVPQEPRIKTAKTQPYPVGDTFVPICPEPGDKTSNCMFTPYWGEPVVVAVGNSGGNAWAPITFSPRTNLVYVPANILSYIFAAHETALDEKTGTYRRLGGIQGNNRAVGTRRAGMLTAMDPTTNKIVWQRNTTYPIGTGSGLLSTAGGLLFQGDADGHLLAYDISNGEIVWKFQTGAGAGGPVSTYEVDGEQYVAVMAGGNNILIAQRGDYLWAFKLGGTLPQAPAPRQPPLRNLAPGAPAPAPER